MLTKSLLRMPMMATQMRTMSTATIKDRFEEAYQARVSQLASRPKAP
jgi:hypothetical protein